MPKSSLKNIFDALTCDSSAEGCDPDWRASVLANAKPQDLSQVREELCHPYYPDELPQKTESRLRMEGKI